MASQMGEVTFRCPKTRQEFGSGFQATETERRALPSIAMISLRCRICGEAHSFKFADAQLKESERRGL